MSKHSLFIDVGDESYDYGCDDYGNGKSIIPNESDVEDSIKFDVHSYNAESILYNVDKIHKFNEVHIDLDQTIGDISILSLYAKIWRHYKQKDKNLFPDYEMFANWFFKKGGFRIFYFCR